MTIQEYFKSVNHPLYKWTKHYLKKDRKTLCTIDQDDIYIRGSSPYNGLIIGKENIHPFYRHKLKNIIK